MARRSVRIALGLGALTGSALFVVFYTHVIHEPPNNGNPRSWVIAIPLIAGVVCALAPMVACPPKLRVTALTLSLVKSVGARHAVGHRLRRDRAPAQRCLCGYPARSDDAVLRVRQYRSLTAPSCPAGTACPLAQAAPVPPLLVRDDSERGHQNDPHRKPRVPAPKTTSGMERRPLENGAEVDPPAAAAGSPTGWPQARPRIVHRAISRTASRSLVALRRRI